MCKILLEHQQKSLNDFFGKEEAEAATEIIVAHAANRKAEAEKLVAEAKAAFTAMDIGKRLEAIRDGEESRKKDCVKWGDYQEVKCPACEGAARMFGKVIRQAAPKDDEGNLVQETIYLPIGLKCYACPLLINGHEYLHGLGLGAQFKRLHFLDPVEHFNVDPSEYGWIDEDELKKARRAWETEGRYDYYPDDYRR